MYFKYMFVFETNYIVLVREHNDAPEEMDVVEIRDYTFKEVDCFCVTVNTSKEEICKLASDLVKDHKIEF